ncbi:MAG: hypothetical protein KAT14_02900 [Candidatus Marinimicrobia bacterium]|nr:hypothetical protein [Candidatus Neomarinimicrobiota bacterium]
MKTIKFDINSFYHIYNRSIGNEKLFQTEKDYYYFIDKMKRYLLPSAHILSYCLIPNHFHFLIRIKEPTDLPAGVRQQTDLPDGREHTSIDQGLKNFFNSYARSYNIAHQRHGRLFQYGYKFKEIQDEGYLMWLIYYIHRNPIHHNLVFSCDIWPYSSYKGIIHNNAMLSSDFVLELFGGREQFIELTSALTLQYKEENLLQRYSMKDMEFL